MNNKTPAITDPLTLKTRLAVSQPAQRFALALSWLTVTSCAIPNNVAVTTEPLGLGATHRASVEAIFPIFVPGGLTAERNTSTGRNTGELVADVVFEGNDRLTQLTQLSGSAAEAVSGAYEERYNGGICQYFIRTKDPQLIEYTREQFSDDEFDELREILEDELDDLADDAYELNRAFDDAVFAFEDSSKELADYLTTVDQENQADFDVIRSNLEQQVIGAESQLKILNTLLEQNERRIETAGEQLKEPDVDEEAILAVNNPCRDFKIGENIIVVSIDQGFEFVLQPDYTLF